MSNIVYIATSLDGFIADQNNGIAWLDMVPAPQDDDLGFADFMSGIDALIMGRNTFEVVTGFDMPWPYSKPVFVASKNLQQVPESLQSKVSLISGSPQQMVSELNNKGLTNLYIDGGNMIQQFLRAQLIDEMIITQVPILLGGGVSLFGELAKPVEFELVGSKVQLGQLVTNHYKRKVSAD